MLECGDVVISNENYPRITKDITGAHTNNRFTYEMCYGIKLAYDYYS